MIFQIADIVNSILEKTLFVRDVFYLAQRCTGKTLMHCGFVRGVRDVRANSLTAQIKKSKKYTSHYDLESANPC